MRAGLVHRIDKNTSGLLVIAKNERAHARLAKQFFDHTITRRYVALVWGNFEEDEGTITGNIGRSPKDRQKMWVFEDGSDGKHAVTHYRVLKRYGYVTLIECRLETGRTHQIRVHMQWKGPPPVRRRTVRRRPYPQRYDLQQIQTVYRKLFRRDAPAGTPCQKPRLPASYYGRTGLFRKRTAGRFPYRVG